MKKEKSLTKFQDTLFRFKEHTMYNESLHSISLFPYANTMMRSKIFRIILNFSFYNISFNKKKALPFFLALELLTNQKCIATLSSKNILSLRLRKGMLVGCKVTLRDNNLFDFIDSLSLTLPRQEKLNYLSLNKIKKSKTNFLFFKLTELVLFYPIELGLGINSEVKKIDINFIFNCFSYEEKLFLLTSNRVPVLNK